MDNVITALNILKKYVDEFERKDPQYQAIKKIVEKWGLESIPLIIANALVSYKLSGRGEDYWTEFAHFFENERPSLSSLIRFLNKSKYNRTLKEQKIRRVRKVWPHIKDLREEASDLLRLRKLLANSLGAKGNEKTIVFALKMTYYAFKALGKGVEGDAPLPVDLRIATLTCSSRLINTKPEEIMGRLRDEAIRRWEEVTRIVGLKMLNLDALLWLPMRGVRELLIKGDLEGARKRFAENLMRYGVNEEEAKRISSLLLLTPC